MLAYAPWLASQYNGKHEGIEPSFPTSYDNPPRIRSLRWWRHVPSVENRSCKDRESFQTILDTFRESELVKGLDIPRWMGDRLGILCCLPIVPGISFRGLSRNHVFQSRKRARKTCLRFIITCETYLNEFYGFCVWLDLFWWSWRAWGSRHGRITA